MVCWWCPEASSTISPTKGIRSASAAGGGAPSSSSSEERAVVTMHAAAAASAIGNIAVVLL